MIKNKFSRYQLTLEMRASDDRYVKHQRRRNAITKEMAELDTKICTLRGEAFELLNKITEEHIIKAFFAKKLESTKK